MISLVPSPLRQCSSRAKVTVARLRLRSVIHSSVSPTLANRSAGLCRRGPYTKGWLTVLFRIFNITTQWPDTEIFISSFNSRYIRNIRSHAETPCAQVSSRSICPFNRYHRKIGPREAETDSSSVSCDAFAARRGHSSSTARRAPAAWKCLQWHSAGVVGPKRLSDPLDTATNTYLKCVWLRRGVK